MRNFLSLWKWHGMKTRFENDRQKIGVGIREYVEEEEKGEGGGEGTWYLVLTLLSGRRLRLLQSSNNGGLFSAEDEARRSGPLLRIIPRLWTCNGKHKMKLMS